jgi:phosphatidylglycerophosphate synthase
VPFYVYALMLHGLIGGLDVFVNHEWLAGLPRQPQAAEEEGLHSAREWIFCALFGSLAWGEWHGASVWWIAALLGIEVLVSARDVVVEGNTRVLPRPERVLHLLLFMNLGALIVLIGQALLGWHALPPGVTAIDHGWASWVLSAMAAGSLVWAVRDALSAARLVRLRGRAA